MDGLLCVDSAPSADVFVGSLGQRLDSLWVAAVTRAPFAYSLVRTSLIFERYIERDIFKRKKKKQN